MQEITRDIVQLIAENLEPIDIVFWAIAHRRLGSQLKHLFEKTLIQKIDNSFREYFRTTKGTVNNRLHHVTNGSYEDFVKAAIESEAIFSGSFLLQLINGIRYGQSDIDIYTKQRASTLWPSVNSMAEVNDIEVVLWAQHTSSCISASIYGYENMIHVRDYAIPDYHGSPLIGFVNFQVITTNSDPKEFVMRTFDFSILQNMFWFDKEGPHIYVTDLVGILNNVIRFDRDEYEKRVEPNLRQQIAQRILKYRSRGFEFI